MGAYASHSWDTMSQAARSIHDHERRGALAAPALAPLSERLQGSADEHWRGELDGERGDNQRHLLDAPMLYRSDLWGASPPSAPHIKGWPRVTATTVPIDDEDEVFHPAPVNETTCAYLRVCARLLQLGGGEPMIATLYGLIDSEDLNISRTYNRSVAFWELHEEEKTHAVGLAYGQLYDAADFPGQMERGEVDLEHAAELYMIREADADVVLGIALQRDLEGRFVWESRVSDTALPWKAAAIPPEMPSEANMGARRMWRAEQWKQTVARAALETYPDPSFLPPPPPPDADRTPPPEPPPIPPSPPPGPPPPADVIAASEMALVAHDYMVFIKEGMAAACAVDEEEDEDEDDADGKKLRVRAAAAGDDGDSRALKAAARLTSRQDGEEEEDVEVEDDDDEAADCDFVIVLLVFAKPLEMPYVTPPRWRPQTTTVTVDKNRMELMAEICETVHT